MKLFADFHIHGKYARATSKNSTFDTLAASAKIKGLNLLGTGDIAHPLWLEDARKKLVYENNGIYSYGGIYWMVTVEVATMYSQDGKGRAVHHMIHLPSLECAQQLQDLLKKYGKMWATDGRPIIGATSSELVEKVLEIDKNSILYPAHCFTPWFGALGNDSGFNSLEDCYQDKAKHIKLLETGMSSIPSDSWRISSLDSRTPISNSDPHGPHPSRLGREANVLETKLDFEKINNAMITRNGFLFTIEVDENYGKYHFSGHRSCGVSLDPREVEKHKGICPACKKKLTIGVSVRIEKMADRKEGYRPKDAVEFKKILPLHEVIAAVLNVKGIQSKKVEAVYEKLIKNHKNEFNVMLNVERKELENTVDKKLVDAIINLREGKMKVTPGYDGVYGKLVLEENNNQKNLKSF